MRTVTSILLTCCLSVQVIAQSAVKRYVTIEHFTNSRCSICASRNPTFYNTIAPHAADVHHISVHPPVPYNNCEFYLANTTENQGWSNIFGIQGTPRIAMNGTLLPGSNPLLPPATLQQYLGQTSPLYVRVIEPTGMSRNVVLQLETRGSMPSGNYKLFAAIVEKTINKTTPNGETVHRDVFRKMLTPAAGVDFAPGQPGNVQTFAYSYNVNPAWNAAETYVVAFVRNMATQEILNSGTRFDPVLVGTNEATPRAVSFAPNPTRSIAYVDLGDDTAAAVEVFDASGRRVQADFDRVNSNRLALSFEQLPRGLYIVHIRGERGAYIARVVRD
jgi:hypothetical protein